MTEQIRRNDPEPDVIDVWMPREGRDRRSRRDRAPSGARRWPHGRSGAAVAAVAGLVLLGGISRVAVVDSRASQLTVKPSASGRGVAAPRTSATPNAASTPVAAASPPALSAQATVLPSIVPTDEAPLSTAPLSTAPLSTAPFALGPLTTVPMKQFAVASDVETDLRARLPVFDPAQALDNSLGDEGGTFSTPAEFVAIFPSNERSLQRELTTEEGLQGALLAQYAASNTPRVYNVTLLRFASAAGARHHLAGFIDGPVGSQGRLTSAASRTPQTYHFVGKSVKGDLHDELYYTAEGDYFAEVNVLSDPTDTSKPTSAADALQILGTLRHSLA